MSDPNPDRDPIVEAPFNPLPKSVIALVAVILGLEALFTLGARGLIGGPDAIGWRLSAVRDWAFADVVWEWMLANGRFPPEQLARFVTYPLIHVSFTHAVFVIVFILALGKLVSEVFGGAKMLIVFFASAILGAVAYGVILNEDAPLIGGYPGVYGLIGAYTFVLWVNLSAAGENLFIDMLKALSAYEFSGESESPVPSGGRDRAIRRPSRFWVGGWQQAGTDGRPGHA